MLFLADPEGTDSDGRLSTVAASDPTAKPPRAGCFAGAAANAARTTGVCSVCIYSSTSHVRQCAMCIP